MNKPDKKYFHELSQKKVDKMIYDGKNWQYILINFKEPVWCGYGDALAGMLGCWSLTDTDKNGYRTKISKGYCKDCAYFK